MSVNLFVCEFALIEMLTHIKTESQKMAGISVCIKCRWLRNCVKVWMQTSTILGQEVAECVLEVVHVRAGYILGIMFVLLIKKYYVLSYFDLLSNSRLSL